MISKRKYLFGTTVLAGILSIAAPSFAQTAPTAPQQDEDEVEEVVVTGSRIARPETSGTIPGVQVGEQDIEERLFTNAGDILNDIPLVGGGANLNGTNGGQTASLGVTYIDLLNLGTARTLTLVNGRRFVSNNSATIFVAGNETGSQVDASTIPVALIDRVDILTVGGAAAYGADAVSGVVNYVLKDDYEGAQIQILGGETFKEHDAGRYSINGVWGQNFLDGRLNVAVSGEYSFINDVRASDRSVRSDNPGLTGNPLNGAQRNPAFVPGGTASVFIGNTVDNILPSVFRPNLRTNTLTRGGLIFNVTQTNNTAENPVIAGYVPGSAPIPVSPAFFQPGNAFRMPGFAQVSPAAWSGANAFTLLQQVPITPFGACITSATDVCAFAPASLTAAQVTAARARYGLASTLTAAQVLAVVQANRPTAREYYAANPSTNVNDFIGTFVPGVPDIANPSGTAGILPRRAVPIRFDTTGNIVGWNMAGELATNPAAPGTNTTSAGGDGELRTDATALRVRQERYVANVIANYQITDNLRFYTENLYSDAEVRNPLANAGLQNSAGGTTPENAGLLVNVNHPFLTAANRTALANAGITGNFILSRNNEDVVNSTEQVSTNETFRSVNGISGDFSLFGRDFGFDISHSYGKADTFVEFSAINDAAYAMAVDAVQVGSNVVCRAQRDGLASYIASYGGNPATGFIPGAIIQPISTIGPDGIRTQSLFAPTITQAMVDACQPLNVFGEGRASQAAKDFVSTRKSFTNESTQNFTQATLTGSLFDLPAGPLQFAVTGEYRKEELTYFASTLGGTGRTRSAPSATTEGSIEATEYGLELRIPLLGEGFNIPFVKSLELNPAIRYTELEGEAETYRNLSGTIVTPTYDGDREEVYTLAGTWEVNDQLLLRGNISKSVRNPSIVELFLGNQAFFTSATDPCRAAGYNAGAQPAVRRVNCIAEVRRIAAANGGALIAQNGVSTPITSDADAEAFILNVGSAGYGVSGASFTGVIAGRQTLVPEKGDSFTFGFVARPSFIPNLIVAADYLEITVTDALGPLLATDSANFCYDSTSYPNNTPDIGVNSCSGIQRDATFNFTNGFELPYFNLGGTRVKAINANLSYSVGLSDVFSTDMDLGTLAFRSNIYYLMEYSTSGIGDFSDASPSENSLANPSWKTQASILYNRGPFNARWTTNFQDAAIVRSGVLQATAEQANVVRYDAYTLHNLSLGYDVNENITARFVVDNVFDMQELGNNGYLNQVYVDSIGRRWTASLTYTF
ncbi:Vitamin B12 transporter BtuB [Brevundimonas subvibrioides]|uniref:TonB-dependent receptor domain-containing protein n=1 Tax=Brevundimonas subvibrioides TaxID=74313 RepID=UPI0032D568C1